MNKCIGCGVIIQSTDENLEGFVPETAKNKSYCQRCFKLIHYGEKVKEAAPKSDKEIIDYVNNHAKEVFFITDFINIYDRTIMLFKKVKPKKTLIINKSDIIPKNISFGEIRAYIEKMYGIKNIIFTNKNSNLNTLIKSLYGKEVYFLGVSNSGKSTIINNLLERHGKEKILSESFKKNTTKDFIKLEFPTFTIYDSPGFSINAFDLDKYANIKKEIKPINYKVKEESNFVINDNIYIRVEGDTNVIFYFSSIPIKRTKKEVENSFTINVSENSDILFLNLGFLKTTKNVKISFDKNLKDYIVVRPSITGGKFGG